MSEQSGEQTQQKPEQGAEQEEEHPVDARLRVYLGRLVARRGRMKAADELNVNYKTLARGLDEPGPLTVWLRAALLVKALEDRLTALAAADEPEPGDARGPAGADPGNAGGIGELADEVRDATEALGALAGAVEELRGEQGERLAALEERLAAVEARLQPEETAETAQVIGAPRIDIREPAPSAGGRPARFTS